MGFCKAAVFVFLSSVIDSTFPFLDKEEGEEDDKKNPHKHIMKLDPIKNDRVVMEKIHHVLLELKSSPPEDEMTRDGFIHCSLIVQYTQRTSDKMRFRIKLDWTGSGVKYEIQRLYEIPAQYQNLIINEKVVSDAQTLETFDIKPKGQIVYVFLVKKKVKHEASGIKVSDFLAARSDQRMEIEGATGGQETVPARGSERADADTDGSSGGEGNADAASVRSSSSGRNKKRKKKHRKR